MYVVGGPSRYLGSPLVRHPSSGDGVERISMSRRAAKGSMCETMRLRWWRAGM